jgi:hypothetical protein
MLQELQQIEDGQIRTLNKLPLRAEVRLLRNGVDNFPYHTFKKACLALCEIDRLRQFIPLAGRKVAANVPETEKKGSAE